MTITTSIQISPNYNAYCSIYFCTQLLPPANEVWGKVIFSVACVKKSVHGGSASVHAGIPPPGADTPPCAVHAGRYGQQAGGMHPTGMQSCWQ